MTHAPAWPRWTIPAVLAGVVVLGTLATIAGALIGVAAGAEEATPAVVLLQALLSLGATVLVLRVVASRARVDLRPAHLGLRPVAPRMALVALGFGLAVALVAGGLTALLSDPALDHPGELGGEAAAITLDAGTAASVLARAVLAAIAAELVLRGFLLPALVPSAGGAGAVVVCGLLGALTAEAPLMPAAAAIGVAAGVMYRESGSILPGIALTASAAAFTLGLSFDWSAAESAALAVAAGAVAGLLAAGPSRSWDPGPARS